jgi:DNA-binding protein YbaB
MFEDLMGNLEQQQAEMHKKLVQFPVSVQMNGITISGNASKTVTNIVVSQEVIESGDKEMLEDLLLTAVNRFIEEAVSVESREAQNMMSSMLPPGFGDMFK